MRNLKKLLILLLILTMNVSNMSCLSLASEIGTEETGTEETGTEETGTEEAGTEEAGTEEAGTEEAGTEETVIEYGEPVWTWSEDFSAATATFTCTTNETLTETVDAVITSEVTKEATEEEEGELTYTASVTFQDQTYTDTKLNTIPVTGHDYSDEPLWSWSDDYSTATAVFLCKNNSRHNVKLMEAVVTATVTKEPTVDEDGEKTYTAVVTKDDQEYSDTKVITLEKITHVHSAGVYYDPDTNVWSYRCKECGETLGDMTVSYYTTKVTKATIKKNGSFYYRSIAYYTDENGKKHYYNMEDQTTTYKASDISLEDTKYTYSGSVQKPAVIVKDSKGNTISESNYKVTYPSGCKNIGKYKITIKFKNRYSGTVYRYYTINPAGVTLEQVDGGNKTINAYWEKNQTQTTGYQLQYSTKSTFKSGVTSVYLNNKTNFYQAKKLKAKTTYYVRVRTYKKVGSTKYYSDWSDVLKSKTN